MADTLPVNFRAEEQPDGTIIVRNVPMFAVCSKQGFNFSESWIDRAVHYHQAIEANRGVTPMHINHHGAPSGVDPAGAWTNTRKMPIRAKDGSLTPGVVIDMVFTDQAAWDRARKNQLLWRSPEIPINAANGKEEPRFGTLALLDRNGPHNDDLPALTFSPTVPNGKTPPMPAEWAPMQGGPVLAFAADVDRVVVLMEPEAMAEPAKKPPVKLEDEPPGDGPPKNEPPKDTKSSVAGVLEKIEAGKYTIDELKELATGLEKILTSLQPSPEPEKKEEPISGGPPDPTIPMQQTPEFIQLSAEVKAMQLRETQRDAADAATKALNDAVDAAATKVEGRATRDDVLQFAESFGDQGPDAAARYAAMILAKVPLPGMPFDAVMSAAAGEQAVPDEVLAFESEGPEAYAWAIGQARLHKTASDSGCTGLTLKRWLEVKAPGGDFVRLPASTEV